MNKNIDDSKITHLRELYQSSSEARKVFDWAARRERDATETTINIIMDKANIDRGQAVKIARDINDIGCGEFIVGRKGAKSRILWSYSLISIGQAAQSKSSILSDVNQTNLEEPVIEQDAAVDKVHGQFLTIAEAKEQLAKSLGVSASAIEITIRG